MYLTHMSSNSLSNNIYTYLSSFQIRWKNFSWTKGIAYIAKPITVKFICSFRLLAREPLYPGVHSDVQTEGHTIPKVKSKLYQFNILADVKKERTVEVNLSIWLNITLF